MCCSFRVAQSWVDHPRRMTAVQGGTPADQQGAGTPGGRGSDLRVGVPGAEMPLAIGGSPQAAAWCARPPTTPAGVIAKQRRRCDVYGLREASPTSELRID